MKVIVVPVACYDQPSSLVEFLNSLGSAQVAGSFNGQDLWRQAQYSLGLLSEFVNFADCGVVCVYGIARE